MSDDRKLLSVIVPCYNEEAVLMQFFDVCLNALDGISSELDYEMIFIDDGSKDRTLEVLKELATLDKNVKYISFSKNFGKEAGIYAGLKNCKGDYVVLMDADLQHPPAYIPEMYASLKTGEYDSVAMIRTDREGEGKLHAYLADKFYSVMNRLSRTDLPKGATDYRMMTRQFVDSILSLSERNRFTKGLFGWVGFKTLWLTYPNTERVGGESKWNFKSLFAYSIEGLVAFSTRPLIYSAVLGGFMSLLGLVLLIVNIVLDVIDGSLGLGLLASLIVLNGGFILAAIGILGVYLSKMYTEIKNRPIYIAGETNID